MKNTSKKFILYNKEHTLYFDTFEDVCAFLNKGWKEVGNAILKSDIIDGYYIFYK